VSISVGIASYPDHASTMEELLQKADIALYQAKRSGKNAVRVFQHDTEK
jgi:diguanylate cyclase (GGDEF)-like protein